MTNKTYNYTRTPNGYAQRTIGVFGKISQRRRAKYEFNEHWNYLSKKLMPMSGRQWKKLKKTIRDGTAPNFIYKLV